MSLNRFAPCVQAPPHSARVKPQPRHRPAKAGRPPMVSGTAPDGFEGPRKSATKVAVLLNARARRVTPAVARQLEAVVGHKHAFYSHSLAEAQRHIASILASGYDTVVCCGGDGTLITAINMMRECIAKQPGPTRMPRFAQLTLGTGNALRQVVGAKEPAADLRNIRDGRSVDRSLSLIEDHDKKAFFFAGVGHDALLMHDYDSMQHSVPAFVSRNMLRSKVGFTAALLLRTAPQMALLRNHGHARVNAEGPCYRIDRAHGDTLIPVPAGEIFSGPIGMLGISTVPWLGYDIYMFPFANKHPELMHLRITQMSLFGMMAHGKSLWHGTFNHPTQCHDFLVTAVDVQLDRKLHYQHSGESQGRADHLHFGVRPRAITMAAQPPA